MKNRVTAEVQLERRGEKILALDYLKVFIVTVVVFHHSILAYVSFFNFNNSFLVAGIIPYTNMINPIIDSTKWSGFDFMVMYNDSYFMSLLFLVSGFFLLSSLKKKGARRFLRERVMRLGLPFILGVLVIAPLSYYPANLQNGLTAGNSFSYYEFWLRFVEGNFPSSGPLWFLWVLLLFNIVVVLLIETGVNIETLADSLFKSPLSATTTLIGGSALFFLPLTFLYDINAWMGFGPFVFQKVRILHYLVYFICGVFIGSSKLDKTLLNKERKSAKYWWVWIILGIVSVSLSLIIPRITFPITCISISLGTMGFFIRYIRGNIKLLDNLSKNIFGIYIFHYIFTSWLQFFFIGISISPIAKGGLVFIGAFILSWITTMIIRRVPYINRII